MNKEGTGRVVGRGGRRGARQVKILEGRES